MINIPGAGQAIMKAIACSTYRNEAFKRLCKAYDLQTIKFFAYSGAIVVLLFVIAISLAILAFVILPVPIMPEHPAWFLPIHEFAGRLADVGLAIAFGAPIVLTIIAWLVGSVFFGIEFGKGFKR